MAGYPASIASRNGRPSRLRPLILLAVPVVALLSQVYLPVVAAQLSFLELPLLMTIYFGFAFRSPAGGLIAGALIGLTQDALSNNPLGMFGMAKSVSGYVAGGLSQHFAIDLPGIRFLLAAFLCFFHSFLFWALANALVGQRLPFDLPQIAVFSVLNGLIAVPLYGVLDRL